MNKKESTLLNKGDIQQPYDSQTREPQILDQIGIWKFEERRKPEYPEKNVSGQGKRTNKPATSLGGECSHHIAMPACPKQKYNYTFYGQKHRNKLFIENPQVTNCDVQKLKFSHRSCSELLPICT